MNTKQPVWELVAQLGDTDPITYGGHFVFRDTTGVYPPEAEVLIEPQDDDRKWEVRRYILEPCTYVNGVLSDNRFHPECEAWFADKLDAIARSVDATKAQLVDLFLSPYPQNRAIAWHEVGSYCGFDNLDSYPLYLTRAQAEARYAMHPYTLNAVTA